MTVPLLTTSAPHIRSRDDIRVYMLDVIVAVVFILIAAVFYNGFRALVLTAVSVLSCLLWEWLYLHLRRGKDTPFSLSTVVTGLFLAFCLPATAPLWFPVVGALFAVVVIKQLFGGLGKNIFNPAAAAVCLLMIWQPQTMGTFPQPLDWMPLFSTPHLFTAGQAILQALHAGVVPANSVLELFLGNQPNFLGTGCMMLLLFGGAYLLYRRIINWQIPTAFIGVVALTALLFPRAPFDRISSLFYELFSGALLFAAFYMATDPVTSPVTGLGQLLYGTGCGLLTALFRRLGLFPEGAFFAIVLMNPFARIYDRAAWQLNLYVENRASGTRKMKQNP